MVSRQDFVATLVAGSSDAGLTDATLAEAAKALGHETESRVLARGIAADLLVPGASGGTDIERRVREVLAGRPVDVIVQPLAHRRKRLFLADMDSTMIAQECIDELADYVGLRAEVAAITERAMRGEIAFEPALRERVALLKDLPVAVVDEIIAHRLTLTPGGRALVQTMRAHGAYAG